MTRPVSSPDYGISLFRQMQTNNIPRPKLVSSQMDHTLPQTEGFTRITDPLVPTENVSQALSLFDPEIYDTRPTSHLVRFVRALIGPAGVGGIRKQMTVARMNATLSNTRFVDLDSFYGAIFNFKRYAVEGMPVLASTGQTLNPLTDVAPPEVWDDALSRDARYRSRIRQLAVAINMGGSRPGIKAVAEAVLSCEVDLIEAWVLNTPQLVTQSAPAGLTYSNISNQYVYYGEFKSYYGQLAGKTFGNGYMTGDNTAEVVLTPRRPISTEEYAQLSRVLSVLAPSHTHITISNVTNATNRELRPRFVTADSEDWDVIVRVTPSNNLSQTENQLYAGSGDFSVARPLYSEYSGESWSYNPNVTRTYTYQIANDVQTSSTTEETVIYQDGQAHLYKAVDAMMDNRQASSLRLSGDGVVTAYPYTSERAPLTKAQTV